MSYGNYPDLSGVEKILVVKMRHLGDVLLTTPVFSSLKKACPKAQIDAYIYEEAREILEGHSAISSIIGYDRAWKEQGFFSKLAHEYSNLRSIHKRGYDLVLNLTEGDRGAVTALFSKAPIRVGFSPKGRWQKKIYTHIVKHTPGLKHTVERNLDILRGIGVFPQMEERELFFHIPVEAKEKVKLAVGEAPYILIHPASRWRFKCWEGLKFRELIQHLLNMGKRVVVTSGKDSVEQELVAQIVKDLDVRNVSGKFTLKEHGALIHGSQLLICVDSVSFHLANALKKRVVAIFGPTSDVTWGPWRNPYAKVVAQNFSCRPCYQDGCGGSKYSDCLATLSVEKVLEAVKSDAKEVARKTHLLGKIAL